MTFEDIIKIAPIGVIKKLEELKSLRERPDYHPEPSAFFHTKIVTTRLIQTGKPDLIVAGVFHDLFKAVDGRGNPTGLSRHGYPTAPHHPDDAAFFIRMNIANDSTNFLSFFTKMGADPERVAKICEQHMRIKIYPQMGERKKAIFREMEIFEDLQIFTRADNMLEEFVY